MSQLINGKCPNATFARATAIVGIANSLRFEPLQKAFMNSLELEKLKVFKGSPGRSDADAIVECISDFWLFVKDEPRVRGIPS